MANTSKIMERIAADVASGKIKKGDLIDPELVHAIASELMGAVAVGYGKDLQDPSLTAGDKVMLTKIQNNAYQFSGFKTAAQLKEVKALLHDSGGNVRDYKDFKADVLKVDSTYNQTYLKTEYITAARQAEMARKWDQIQDEKETLPYLMYQTVHDSRVSCEHKKLDGIVRKVDDAFWKKYYPPLRWRCRCSVRQLAKGTETDISEIDMEGVDNDFKNNVGITGAILPVVVYETGFTPEETARVKKISEALVPVHETFRERNIRVLNKPIDEQYQLLKEHESGGTVHQHVLVATNEVEYRTVRHAAKVLAKEGGRVEILPEMHQDHLAERQIILSGAKERKNPDLRVNGEYVEVKHPETKGNYISNIKKKIAKAAHQADKVIVVLDEIVSRHFLQQIAIERFKFIKELEEITFVIGNTRVVYTRKANSPH